MASWSHHFKANLYSTHCPVHGSLVVQDEYKRWLWRCWDCLTEAALGMLRQNGGRP